MLKDEGYINSVLLRAEKLSSALYRVTELLPDNEPIKWQLRNTAIAILSDINSCPRGTVSERIALLDESLANISEINSLLNVSVAGNLVSDMNASLLKREFANLKVMLEDRERLMPEMIELSALDEAPSLPILEKRPEIKADGNRKAAILEFLKSNGEATISDICAVVTGCSSKTVQRELVSMVSGGIVKRKGEKRWSRYFL